MHVIYISWPSLRNIAFFFPQGAFSLPSISKFPRFYEASGVGSFHRDRSPNRRIRIRPGTNHDGAAADVPRTERIWGSHAAMHRKLKPSRYDYMRWSIYCRRRVFRGCIIRKISLDLTFFSRHIAVFSTNQQLPTQPPPGRSITRSRWLQNRGKEIIRGTSGSNGWI